MASRNVHHAGSGVHAPAVACNSRRSNLIWAKEQLLAPLPPGIEALHTMRLGDDENDNQCLGGVRLTGPARSGSER